MNDVENMERGVVRGKENRGGERQREGERARE